MGIFKDAKEKAEAGYNEAETKVDNWFVKNGYTVVILSGVAAAGVFFVLRATVFCG